jgi:hypothetical protein
MGCGRGTFAPAGCSPGMRALLLLLLGVVAAPTQAMELQGEWGQCRFGKERDGVFWQSDRHTQNYMTPYCATLGLTDRYKDGPFGWRIGFVWAGFIEGRDNIATLRDDDAFLKNLVCHDAPPPPERGAGCLASHNGFGHTWGFSFGPTYERRLFGPVKVVAEGALFFFRHNYKNHAQHVDCTTCKPNPDYDQSSGPFADPIPMLGLTLRAYSLYFAVRYYWPGEHRPLSLTDHSFTQLSTGLAFRL